MKPRASLPITPVRRTTTRHRRGRQRTETLDIAFHEASTISRLLTALLALVTAVVVGWVLLSTPLWVVPVFGAIVSLPFVLTYLAVQFAGVLVALDEAR